MKKFDMSAIMRNAWNIRRERSVAMSTAMKLAWSEAKGCKMYFFNLDANREAVRGYLVKLGAALEAGLSDIHQVHKFDILATALDYPMDKEGVAVVDGKTVGLLKYAVRNAA